MTTHKVKVDGKLYNFDLNPINDKTKSSVPLRYQVVAPGVIPFEVEFPNHLRSAKQILSEVYHEWEV